MLTMVKQSPSGAKFFIHKTTCLVRGVHSNQILWVSVYLLPYITAPSSCRHCAGGRILLPTYKAPLASTQQCGASLWVDITASPRHTLHSTAWTQRCGPEEWHCAELGGRLAV